jgi:hypothetical protein
MRYPASKFVAGLNYVSKHEEVVTVYIDIHAVLISILDANEWSAPSPGRFIP